MPDYHGMYLRLFNAQADVIETLVATTDMLIKVHKEMEELVMDESKTAIALEKHTDEIDEE